jgi:HEAT repeat protein
VDDRSSDAGPLVYRVAYIFGQVLRQAVQALTFPWRALAERSTDRRALPPATRGRLPARSRRVPIQAVRAAAADGLQELSKVLANRDPEVRRLALQTVENLEEERATTLIVDLLHDADARVRCAAAAAAGRAQTAGAMFSLILALDDASLEVRQEAVRAIEQITGEPLEIEPSGPRAARQEKIEQLKQSWKERRLAQLASRLQAEGP